MNPIFKLYKKPFEASSSKGKELNGLGFESFFSVTRHVFGIFITIFENHLHILMALAPIMVYNNNNNKDFTTQCRKEMVRISARAGLIL